MRHGAIPIALSLTALGALAAPAAAQRDTVPLAAPAAAQRDTVPRVECPSRGYCENIVRQVRRYFRRPEGESGSATVCFTIQRDGGVDDVEVHRVRGGFLLRLAAYEAVEQAGLRKAFGAFPSAFDTAKVRFCVNISPQM